MPLIAWGSFFEDLKRKKREFMKKIQTETQAGDAAKVTALVTKLNRYRHEYYNLATPSVPDAVYDHLFDELQELEKKTGIILSNSPTQTVGAAPISSLKKVKHPIPLLSLDKTKQLEELLAMAGRSASLMMLKLDGLTVKICYENGRLVEASTRGDGETGELVTHNIPAFDNVPLSIYFFSGLLPHRVVRGLQFISIKLFCLHLRQ